MRACKWFSLIVLGLGLAVAGSARGDIVYQSSGLIRASGSAARDTTAMDNFLSGLSAQAPGGQSLSILDLADHIGAEGLLGGPAAGAFYQGSTVPLPAGLSLSAVGADAAVNGGLAGSTALFIDLQDGPTSTANLYYLGDPAEGATDPNRVQFPPTDIGTNADDVFAIRPVSFDSAGEAIEVRGSNEKGVLEAGRFRLNFGPQAISVYGVVMTFIDTETNGTTYLNNITIDDEVAATSFAIPAGRDDNEYFVGFLADEPLDSLEVKLGQINGCQTGGDGVLIDVPTFRLITLAPTPVPEPATVALLGVGGAAMLLAWRRRRRITT